MYRVLLLGSLVLLAGCGRRGGIIVYGFGETIEHLASFDETTAGLVAERFELVEPSVDLKYDYLSLFFLDVWTSEADVVFCDGNGEVCADVPDDLLLEYTGRTADEFDRPFFYRYPPGALVIGGAVLWFLFLVWRGMRDGLKPG